MNGIEHTMRFHGVREWSIGLSHVVQLVLAAIGLVLLSPVMAIVALAVKLSSPGPVFYRGVRIGKDARPFIIYKFRTLQQNAENKIGARLLRPDDGFYTSIGKFLKKTKLDELPQLINVLRGEMALVGPRPVRPVFFQDCVRQINSYEERFLVRPGLSGVAQLRGGYWTHPRNKLRYERIYLKRRGLLLDLKLVGLTLLKLFGRWFTLGFMLLLLFVFLSFLPSWLYPSLYVRIFGFSVNGVHLLLLALFFRTFLRWIPSNRLYIYRCALNLPALAFVLFTGIATLWSVDPIAALRGAAYYLVTGFSLILILSNGEISQSSVRIAVRVVALTATLVSLGSLVQLVLMNGEAVAAAANGLAWKQGQSFYGLPYPLRDPAFLATYLVLGLPILFSEVAHAKTQFQRDFWLICSTIASFGIVMTQTRIGLIALAVTGTVFFARRSTRALAGFLGLFGVLLLILALLGGPRFSVTNGWIELGQKWSDLSELFSSIPVRQLLIGVGTKNLERLEDVAPNTYDFAQGDDFPIPNMHLTLILENGLVGWLLMMWVIGAVLKELYCGYRRIHDRQIRTVLWAIFSSVLGFLISMNIGNVFFHLTIQVLFWGLVAVGLATILRFGGFRPGFVKIWRFGD
jgi:lipopolysaccharide/colanic/teichoic acid biosynthesis glycosyltransferase